MPQAREHGFGRFYSGEVYLVAVSVAVKVVEGEVAQVDQAPQDLR